MKITGKLRKIGDIPVIVQKETVHITERKDEPFNLAEFANKLLEDENWRKNLFKHLKSNIVFGGGEGAVQKFPVVHVNTVTVDGTYTVSGVKEGINIYGIDHSSDVTVYLPKTIPQDRMIYIKDVSGNANTYPITIQMEV
ncbi:MAG: hypothetical protein ACMV1B_01655 [Prevotella sp.]